MKEIEQSETGDDDSRFDGLSGFALLEELKIPVQPLVYCDKTQGLVKVTDRQSPVGLCFNLDDDSGLYMTADEIHAYKNYIKKVDYHLGFFVATPSQRKYTMNMA